MNKIDLKKELRHLFTAPVGEFVEVEVPPLPYLKVDGHGDPNVEAAYAQALSWLFSTAYAAKFAAKTGLGRDFTVPPLEGLWWAEDPQSFVDRRKALWSWTMMIMLPDFIGQDLVDAAVVKSSAKLGEPPTSFRFELLHEGRSLQALHIGSYDDEGPLLAQLHNEIMPARGLAFAGPHHEIYLGDPRRTEPARLKTILRQPVRPSE
jgi:hypothetical protein